MESVKFKPFDKVLVRDDVNEPWCIGLYDSQLSENKHLCINGVYRHCIAYDGNEELLGTIKEFEDLDIDTPVMCNCGADKKWHFGYYAGHGEVWMHGCRSTDNVGRCEWYNIIPFSEFNPEDLDGSLEYNLVKHEGQKG